MKKINKIYVNIIFRIISWTSLCRKILHKRKSGETRSLLVVFINAIGDFVIFTSIFDGIRERFDDYDITLLGFDRWKSLVKNIPDITFIPFNRKKIFRNPFYLVKILLKLKKRTYSIALYPSYSRMPLGDYLMEACNAEEKIAYNGDINNISEKEKQKNNRRIYTRLIEKPLNTSKEIDFYHYFALQLNIKKELLGLPSIKIIPDDCMNAKKILNTHLVGTSDRYVVLAPGAASDKRIWDMEKYAEICMHLHNNNFKILIVGSTADKYYAKEIQGFLEFDIIDLTGKTTLIEVAAIFEKALFYFGSESGLLHVAIAVGIPTICIMGGGHAFRFYPYGNLSKHRTVYNKMNCYNCNWRCIYNDIKCIKEIDTRQALKEVDFFMKGIYNIEK